VNVKNEDQAQGDQRFRFPADRRVRSGLDFERIYALKRRMGDPCLLVFAAQNGLPQSRIGVSVSRKHGNSVVRHRLRRLLKEAFRLEQHELPTGIDLILIPGRDSSTATVDQFRQSLRSLSHRVARKLDGTLPGST